MSAMLRKRPSATASQHVVMGQQETHAPQKKNQRSPGTALAATGPGGVSLRSVPRPPIQVEGHLMKGRN